MTGNNMHGKIVIFGSGATGRGHIGLLAWLAGFEIVFVDNRNDLVETLHRVGHYKVKVYGVRDQEFNVSGFRVYPSEERLAIANEIVGASLVLTAVFDQNLSDVAKTIALAISACRLAGRRSPLNCIACENMMDSSSVLGKFVKIFVSEEDRDYCEKYFGFPDCMISRVVPQPRNDPLTLVTEDYNEWTVRAEAFKGEKPPALDVMELVDNQTARLERKLFIHNGGHAVCGYFGFHRGHIYVHEAVKDPYVVKHVLGALNELGEIVRVKHGFSRESIDNYKQDLVRRGGIAELQDEILRVIRDPIRKLSSKERLVAPALEAETNGLPHEWIIKGIVAALHYKHENDLQSIDLAKMIENSGLGSVLENVCKINPGSSSYNKIIHEWQAWARPEIYRC
jgi:mannitol-1-phosphate 5-dehydrogenase